MWKYCLYHRSETLKPRIFRASMSCVKRSFVSFRTSFNSVRPSTTMTLNRHTILDACSRDRSHVFLVTKSWQWQFEAELMTFTRRQIIGVNSQHVMWYTRCNHVTVTCYGADQTYPRCSRWYHALPVGCPKGFIARIYTKFSVMKCHSFFLPF